VVGPVIDEAGEHIGEVALRIDAVELAGLDQGGHGRPSRPAIVAGGEQRILPAEADRPDGALDRVVVELGPAVLQELHQAVTMVQRVPDACASRRPAAA